MKYSLLDLAPVTEEGTAATALHNAADIAKHAEKWGYSRFWMAEHHNMEGIASAATAVALGYVASKTEHIRVGSAGIMLPNHAPFVVAEQFGTLDALYPGRQALMVPHYGHCAALRMTQRTSRVTCKSYLAIWQKLSLLMSLKRYLAMGKKYRFGCWGPVPLGRSLQLIWGYRTPSPHTSHRTICTMH